ncbi:hypothetical protein [Agrococcus casei]|uniref:hypothetical protein n=1 Tax=Agrococcus casei TaxID=343512 RepID=UPI0011781B7B|nr:hypothetical protein [Agrococcus casei]
MERGSSHSEHRFKQAKVRGIVTNPPEGSPFEVCVHNQSDWELVYRNRALHVQCLVPSCETRLIAKRMSGSGLRFFAAHRESCSHNLVNIPVGRGEIDQDPATLANGGGPEGQEHLWIKGRLHKIATSIGLEAVIEDSTTHADVFLPGPNLALEYQRWDTDFSGRTAARATTGGAHTLWLFPFPQPEQRKTPLKRVFDREVYGKGGLYVAVRNMNDLRELQQPWLHPSQERTARLYATGAIARFDKKTRRLVYTRGSLARILNEIVTGQRTLTLTTIYSHKSKSMQDKRVWALKADLAAAEDERKRRPPTARPIPAPHTRPVSVENKRPIPTPALDPTTATADTDTELSELSELTAPTESSKRQAAPATQTRNAHWWERLMEWVQGR